MQMRIRKLAKLHGFTFCSNNADSITPPSTDSPAPPFLQSHICHLNQSPWDVVTFSPDSPSPPPAFQVHGDANDANDAPSFVDSTGAVESDVGSMNNNNTNIKETQPGKGNRRHGTAAESSSGAGRRFPISKQATTNSYDFYYYSGFGPRWGKRRGLRNEIGIMEAEVEDEMNADQGMDYVEFDEEEEEEEDDDYNEDESDNGVKTMTTMKKKRGRKPIKARSLKSLM